MTKEQIAREAADQIVDQYNEVGYETATVIILAAIEEATTDILIRHGEKDARVLKLIEQHERECHAAQPQRSEQFDPSKTEVDPVLERANELRRKYTDSKPHIVKEGSREHVICYDSHGAHCSEPNCEINHFVPDRTIKLEWHDGPEFRKWMASSEIEDAYEAGYIAASRAGAASGHAPEDCKLVAHNTGDGWYLGVEDRNGDDIAMLRWPWGDKGKTAKQLEEYGYEIV